MHGLPIDPRARQEQLLVQTFPRTLRPAGFCRGDQLGRVPVSLPACLPACVDGGKANEVDLSQLAHSQAPAQTLAKAGCGLRSLLRSCLLWKLRIALLRSVLRVLEASRPPSIWTARIRGDGMR